MRWSSLVLTSDNESRRERFRIVRTDDRVPASEREWYSGSSDCEEYNMAWFLSVDLETNRPSGSNWVHKWHRHRTLSVRPLADSMLAGRRSRDTFCYTCLKKMEVYFFRMWHGHALPGSSVRFRPAQDWNPSGLVSLKSVSIKALNFNKSRCTVTSILHLFDKYGIILGFTKRGSSKRQTQVMGGWPEIRTRAYWNATSTSVWKSEDLDSLLLWQIDHITLMVWI
jgi:hypothetical protein